MGKTRTGPKGRGSAAIGVAAGPGNFATSDSSTASTIRPAAQDRRIHIRHETFGVGFDVTVEPAAPWASFNQERPNIRSARRYAESLRIVHGWRIVDETGEAA